jgi:serine protease
MTRSTRTLAAVALLSAAFVAAPARGSTGLAPAHGFAPRQVVLKLAGAAEPRTVALRGGAGVRRTVAALRADPRVAYAAPNYLASASAGGAASTPLAATPSLASIADDPGPLATPPGPPGGWVSLQWNFLPWRGTATPQLPVSAGGIDAVGAWRNLIAAGRGGAKGVVVAVLDTGIAYRNYGEHFRRSPDFAAQQFVPGYDFVEGDRLPLDQNGHGTHVAGTIAERTNNGVGLTGLAYGAKLMPVRVLDRHGSGEADDIAHGIHFAVAHGADVINMSFNFGCGNKVPGIDEELRDAYRAGVVVVASIGNLGSEACVSPPATSPHAIGVGGATEGGCLGGYSLLPGDGVDLLAPGGGFPVVGCPSVLSRSIFQVTLRGGSPLHFAEPGSYIGTSMAAAHVSGVAAMVLASRVLPAKLSPEGRVNRVTRRLRKTARDLGLPTQEQGGGLIDAAAATTQG